MILKLTVPLSEPGELTTLRLMAFGIEMIELPLSLKGLFPYLLMEVIPSFLARTMEVKCT